MPVRRLILIGLSGTGKSTVAPILARLLGLRSIDTDKRLREQFGTPVTEIVRQHGFPVFRAAERDVLHNACQEELVVIATGGGVVLDEANWEAMRPGSVIVNLEAPVDYLVERLRQSASDSSPEERPLLAGDPQRRLRELWAEREALYRRADLTISTLGRSPLEVAEAIQREIGTLVNDQSLPIDTIQTPAGRSDIYLQAGMLAQAGELFRRRWPDTRRAWIVADENVGPHYLAATEESLRDAGFEVRSNVIPAGEASKSFTQVQRLLDWLLEGRIDRRDLIVALGGGVVGDLAGFVAAIALRGVRLVQVPTSLLAMVDSSVGGKTGIDHQQGKNLIGAFYQPGIVLVDPTLLATLPERELRAGFAEVAKYGMIEGSANSDESAAPAFFAFLETLPGLESLRDVETISQIVTHNIRLKATVVRQDERETGLRRLLNYGHTLGHAFEASGYQYLHGEAVALGLRAAARVGLRMGSCSEELVQRQDDLLDRFGLPRQFDGDLDEVNGHLAADKKAVYGQLRWILPVEIGYVEISSEVPLELVREVAIELGARAANVLP